MAVCAAGTGSKQLLDGKQELTVAVTEGDDSPRYGVVEIVELPDGPAAVAVPVLAPIVTTAVFELDHVTPPVASMVPAAVGLLQSTGPEGL